MDWTARSVKYVYLQLRFFISLTSHNIYYVTLCSALLSGALYTSHYQACGGARLISSALSKSKDISKALTVNPK